jgi:hypothetical protein
MVPGSQVRFGMAVVGRSLSTATGQFDFESDNKKPARGGFFVRRLRLNYFSLISLYSTCLRAFGSNFMIDIFSGIVFLFLLVV